MLTFRPATAADTDEVVALVTSAYRGEASTVGWTTEAHLIDGVRITPELLQHDLDNPEGRVLLAVEAAADSDGGTDEGGTDEGGTDEGGTDEIVACCNLVRKGGGVGYFGMFAVSPARQGTGVGKIVLEEAERVLRDEWGCAVMEMTVLERRPELTAFYERRGFTPTGEFEPFPYGDERFGTPRVEGLRLASLRKTFGHPTVSA